MRLSLKANRKQRLNVLREYLRFKCKYDIERPATAVAPNWRADNGSLASYLDIMGKTLLSQFVHTIASIDQYRLLFFAATHIKTTS
jgi:hypothetical protein